MKTKKILKIYLFASITYLVFQELLNFFIYYSQQKNGLETFCFSTLHFVMPIVSIVLILISFLILWKFYCPLKGHYLLYIISWSFLFFPQVIPTFIYQLNIIYATWIFILSTIITFIIISQELIPIDLENVPGNRKMFIYNELKFYLEKFSFGWLTLGTILAVCMTILWTAPCTSFTMSYYEKVSWALYMLFSFIVLTILLVIFIACPILRSIMKIRENILGKKT